MTVLLIAGSPTTPSRSSALLEAVGQRLESRGARIDRIAVRDLPAQPLLHAVHRQAGSCRLSQTLDITKIVSTEVLRKHWSEIRRVVERGQVSSLHCSIASVGEDGTPTVTPIGTVFLGSEPGGFFFDRYTSDLGKNINTNGKICLLAVNSGKWFWFRSLTSGRFPSPPGVRLYGKAGPLREATPIELSQIENRIRSSKWLKGTQLLWSSFTHVRDLEFTSFRPVSYPVMMEHLWQ